jgi:predicted AlkP superfamily pyrophosphatase or phosphodiesterase
MKRTVAPIAAALVLACSVCSPRPRAVAPRLVVLIVIDQMRSDQLLDSAERFESGLARLYDEGTLYENAHHAHALTLTGSGHATLASGVHPSRSGIIGNSWWERGERAHVGSVADPATRRLDQPELTGASAFRMRVATLGDWLKQANPDSQVWAVSIKDRSAVLSAGRNADGAFWYDFDNGRFVTSDNYMAEEPGWVRSFDEARSIEAYRDGWHLLRDSGDYSRPDDAAGEVEPRTFPPLFSNGDAYYEEVAGTPFGDRFTFDFATALIDGQQLGADEASDLLIVSASSADAIGHGYGPWSRETEDYYFRLDFMLGEFFEHLDAVVGPGRWLVALSSDHGVLPLPEQTAGARHSRQEILGLVQSEFVAAAEAVGVDPSRVRLEAVNGLVLDADADIDPATLAALRDRMAANLRANPRIEDVFTWDELASDATLNRPYEAEFRRSFDPRRSADLMVRFPEFDLGFWGASGTTHGSAYSHDTHVPMIFLGAGVPARRFDTPVRTVDLAPTLASCLGLEPPDGLDGEIRFPCSE